MRYSPLVLGLPVLLGTAVLAPNRAVVTQSFDVRRHTVVTTTQANVDAYLAGATSVLLKVDGAGDNKADVSLVRSGALGTIAGGTGTITSSAEFAELFSPLSGNLRQVRIVEAITKCGRAAGPDIIGCADTPGYRMAVVLLSSLNDILWAHEFGHTQGLDHRDETFAVMHGTIDTDHRRINKSEADSFQKPKASARGNLLVAQQDSGKVSVDRFVRRRYIHGVPYEAARAYSSRAADTLLQMLRDSSNAVYFGRIAATLGAIGGDSAYTALIRLADQNGRTAMMEGESYRTQTSILMALGWLGHMTRKNEVVDYLEKTARPQRWMELRGALPDDVAQDRSAGLASTAILALGLTGAPAAREALRRVERESQALATVYPSLRETAREAIDLHSEVAASGLSGYYRK